MNPTSRFFTILLLTGLLGCQGSEEQSAVDLTIPVSTTKVTTGSIASTIQATGTLRAVREERILTEVTGRLQLAKRDGRTLRNGMRVRKGMLLATLENEEYRLTVRADARKLEMENAQRELEKQEALFKEGGVTEKELEIARSTALDTRLNYETALLKLAKLRLTSPLDGTLAMLQVSAGGTLVPAGFHLCTIYDNSSMLLDLHLPNSDISRIRTGQRVIVSTYAIEEQTFSGEVVAIDPSINPQTRTFTSRVRIENPDRLLRSGMFVKAEVIIEQRDSTVVIPREAVQMRSGRPVAFVVLGASAELREVVTGLETRDRIEIISGLEPGENLVVKGYETLRDKSRVRVTHQQRGF